MESSFRTMSGPFLRRVQIRRLKMRQLKMRQLKYVN